jgi:hypothetical protein
MEVHQTEFLQAVVLAGAVALGMTVWESGRDEARVYNAPARTAGMQYTLVKKSRVAAPAPRIEVQR